MSRLVNRPITTTQFDLDGTLLKFEDQGIVHVVTDVVDRWIESGESWNGEGQGCVWRVLTSDNLFDVERAENAPTPDKPAGDDGRH